VSGGNRNGAVQKFREQSCERELKKSSAAERSAEGRSRSGERRSQKWERGAAKQPAPLRSAPLQCSAQE